MDGYPPYPPAYSPPQSPPQGLRYPLNPVGPYEPPPPYSPPCSYGFNTQPGVPVSAQPSPYSQPPYNPVPSQNTPFNPSSSSGYPPQNYAASQQPGYYSNQNGRYGSSQGGPPPRTDSVESTGGLYPSLSQPNMPVRTAPPPPSRPSIDSSSPLGFAGGTGPNQHAGPSDVGRATGSPAIGFNTDRTSSTRLPTVATGPWKDTPLPAGLREVWLCVGCRGIYFLQEDGSIVSPTNSNITIKVYINDGFDFSRCPSRRGSNSSSRGGSPVPGGTPRDSPQRTTVGFAKPKDVPQKFSMVVECPGVFRIKLSPVRGHSYITSARDFLAIVDLGTYPGRSVVIHLPRDMDPKYLEKLLNLLEEYAILTTETGGVINTVSSTLESAFNFTTKKSSDLFKDATPGLHKSTKFLRKGGGNIVRLGGSLFSKGINLVAETVSPTPQEEKMQEFDPRVNQLKNAIACVKEAMGDGSVTVVEAPRGL